jgi:hypothetical protein
VAGLQGSNTSEILAGEYDAGMCLAACQNSILDNWLGAGRYDARAYSSAMIWAEFNNWGSDRTLIEEDDLDLIQVGGGDVLAEPFWDGTAPRMGAQAGVARTPRAGAEGTLPLPDSSAVAALVEAAYTAIALGDSAAASAALLLALPLAQTPEEQGLAYGMAARFLSRAGDPALESYLATRTVPGDGARPYAMTALMAADAAEGRTEQAWAAAGTLSTEYAGTEHALPGLGMRARLAFEAGDLASAEAALAGLEAGWPELLETASAAALVRRLEEDSLAAGASGRFGLPAGRAPTAVTAAAGAAEGVRLLGARPNPFTQQTAVPFEVAEASRVRLAVYDVLGREVALLAAGAFEPGRYEASFDGRGLAAGLYLVRAHVESGSGPGRSYVERITLVR